MNCRGCESIQVGGTQATHSDDCRKRVIERISETDAEKAAEIWERLRAWSDQLAQQRARKTADASVQAQGAKDPRKPESEPAEQPSKKSRSEATAPTQERMADDSSGALPPAMKRQDTSDDQKRQKRLRYEQQHDEYERNTRKAEDQADDERLDTTGAGTSSTVHRYNRQHH